MKSLPIKDILIALLIMIVSIVPRVILIDQIPLGIHGDEAWTGLDAVKIMEGELVPAYSPSALGQPSGPAYLTALFFKLLGINVISLRLSMAFFGILTIPFFYFFIKRLYGSTVSVIITLLFAFSLIHLHYSRIGFMLISAPLFVIGTLYFFSRFIAKKRLPALIVSAVFCGLGMYSYNSYILFPPLMMLGLVLLLFTKRIRLQHVALFVCAFTAAASILLAQIAANPKEYFSHHKTVSVFNQEEFKAGKTGQKLAFMYENGLKKTKAFLIGHLNDGADGYGDFQSVDYLILAFAIAGIFIAVMKRNNYMLWLLIGLLIQLIPLFSTVDGYYRRVLIAYIFLYIFAAYALSELLKILQFRKKIAAVAIITVVAVGQISLNLWQYFMLFPASSIAQFVFSPGVYVGLEAIRDNEKVLLYSERYDCNYETFRFLLHGRTCVYYKNEEAPVESTGEYVRLYIDDFINTGLQEDHATLLNDRDDKIIAVIVR